MVIFHYHPILIQI